METSISSKRKPPEAPKLSLVGTIPEYQHFGNRKEEETVQDAVISLCLKSAGFLAIIGESGVGKTALIANLLSKTLSTFLPSKCPNVKMAIWLNSAEFALSQHGEECAFFLKLANILGIELEDQSNNVEEQFDQALVENKDSADMFLLVVDGVTSPTILRRLVHVQHVIRCLAILRKEAIITEFTEDDTICETINVKPMSDDEVVKLLLETYKMSDQLWPEQIREIATMCKGLPSIANLIRGFICNNDKLQPDTAFKSLHKFFAENAEIPPALLREKLISLIFSSHFENQSASKFREFATLLLFPPGYPLPIEHLALLWNQPVKETFATCNSWFANSGLLQICYKKIKIETKTKPKLTTRKDPAENSFFTLHSVIRRAAISLLQATKLDVEQIILRARNNDDVDGNILHLTANQGKFDLFNALIQAIGYERLYSFSVENDDKNATPLDYIFRNTHQESSITAGLQLLDKLSVPNTTYDDTNSRLSWLFGKATNAIAPNKLLLQACENGFINVTTYLIEQEKANNSNCLLFAARYGHEEIVRLLLKRGVPVNGADNEGRHAIHYASGNGHIKVVELLIQMGADFRTKDAHGKTALTLASSRGQREIVDILLLIGDLDYINALDDKGNTALIYAAENGYNVIAAKLLEKGANPNMTNNYKKMPPLCFAALRGHPKVLKTLLDKKADPNSSTDDKKTALYLAVENRQIEAVKTLLLNKAEPDFRCFDRRTPFMLACEIGEEHIASLLLGHGADPNARKARDETALHLATVNQHIGIIKLLIESKVDPNARNSEYHTPLMVAVKHRCGEATMKALIDGGGHVNAKGRGGTTALIMAAYLGIEIDLVRLLIKASADMEAKNNFGENALLSAASVYNMETVKFLLNKKATTSSRNNDNHTVLSYAIESQDDDVVSLCLQHGAVVVIDECLKQTGETPLMIGARKNSVEITSRLLQKGANLRLMNKHGLTALMVAASYGSTPVVKALLHRDTSITEEEAAKWLLESELLRHVLANDYENAKITIGKAVKDVNFVNTTRNGRTTALIEAVRKENDGIVDFLLSKMATPNSRTAELRETPLMIAAVKGNVAMVKRLLEKGAEPNASDKFGQTALKLATDGGFSEVVKILLEKHADPNIRCNDGSTPLSKAAEYRYLEIAKLLLQKGADPNSKCCRGRTSLMEAASVGCEEIVNLLIENNGSDEIDAVEQNGNNALMLAVQGGHQGVVKLLLAKGANRLLKNKADETALTIMVRCGKPSWLVDLLFDGSKKDVEMWRNEATLMQSVVTGDVGKVANLLTTTKADTCLNGAMTALTTAVEQDRFEIVKTLLDAGADPNKTNGRGESPLVLAAAAGSDTIVTLLLSRGADPLQKIDGHHHDRTALHVAVEHLHSYVANILLEYEQDQTNRRQEWRDELALLLAARNGDEMEVKKVIEERSISHVDVCRNGCVTALLLAAEDGNESLIRFLLDKGANVNKRKTTTGETPLMLTPSYGNDIVVELMLTKGANPNIKDKKGDTALLHAVRNGWETITERLLNHGANVTVKNKDDKTALSIASERSSATIIDMLQRKLAEITPQRERSMREDSNTSISLVQSEATPNPPS